MLSEGADVILNAVPAKPGFAEGRLGLVLTPGSHTGVLRRVFCRFVIIPNMLLGRACGQRRGIWLGWVLLNLGFIEWQVYISGDLLPKRFNTTGKIVPGHPNTWYCLSPCSYAPSALRSSDRRCAVHRAGHHRPEGSSAEVGCGLPHCTFNANL